MTQKPPIKKDTVFAADAADKLYSDTVSVFNDSVHMTVGPDLDNRVKRCLSEFLGGTIKELELLETKCNYNEEVKTYVADRIIFYTEIKIHIEGIKGLILPDFDVT